MYTHYAQKMLTSGWIRYRLVSLAKLGLHTLQMTSRKMATHGRFSTLKYCALVVFCWFIQTKVVFILGNKNGDSVRQLHQNLTTFNNSTDARPLMNACVNKTSSKTIYGSRFEENQWSITAQHEKSIITIYGSLTGTDYLYIETKDNKISNKNHFLVFQGSKLPCFIMVRDTNFTIHARAHIHLELDLAGALSDYYNLTNLDSSIPLCVMEEYDNLVTCTHYVCNFKYNYLSDWTYYTHCDFKCPEGCTSVLGDQQVTYNCSTDNCNQSTNQKAFIIYPSDITHLNFSSNNLVLVQPDAFATIGNQIIRLDLGKNQLQKINFLRPLLNLQELGVTSNKLSVIENGQFEHLQSMNELWLYVNNLEVLQRGAIHGLATLDKLIMWGVGLRELKYGLLDDVSLLQVLELSMNPFTTLAPGVFQNLTNLKYLGLKQGQLVALESGVLSGLETLQNLYIDSNRLKSIDEGTFHGLYQLNALVLSDNELTTLSVNLFMDLLLLSELDLSYNNLVRVPELGHLINLQHLDLKGNPLMKITKSMFSGLPVTSKVTVQQPEVCICYLSHIENCSAIDKQSEYLTCDRLLSIPALAIFTWILGMLAVSGNVAVLVWRNFFEKGGLKVMGILLSNLAMSDLLMGVYMLIIASADAYFGDFFPMNAEDWRTGILCRFAGALVITSSEASVLFVTLISIDRFICIKYPYSQHKLGTKSAHLLATLTWLLSMILGIVPSILAGRNDKFYDNSHVCIGLPLTRGAVYQTEQRTLNSFYNGEIWYSKKINVTNIGGFETEMYYSTALFFGFNFLCLLIILACYIDILKTIYKTSKEAGRERQMKEQIRMCSKVAIIIGTDFCCWVPTIVIGILGQSGVVEVQPHLFAWIVTFVLPINSAINPFLYTLTIVISDIFKKKKTVDTGGRTLGASLAPSPRHSPQHSMMKISSNVKLSPSHIKMTELTHVPTSTTGVPNK